MAVLAGIYGKCEPEYIGCVLDTYEHNGYDDSDWYAICWDEREGKVVEVNYDTTRAGGGGWSKIDATEETLRKAYRYYFTLCRLEFDKRWNELQAKDVKVGDDLKVVRGRKVPKGTVGKCFWRGTRYNQYSFRNEERVGLEINRERRRCRDCHRSFTKIAACCCNCKGGYVKMTDEITKALDMLYSEETMTEYQKRESERRRLFFKALGIQDDGRRNPCMTEDEFRAFDKPSKDLKYNELKGKTTVEVYFKFEPYQDVSYTYCFEDDTVYESRFYIGD